MTADDATINAVAAAIDEMELVYETRYERNRQIARALAEAGRLKDPADRVLTPTDQAVLDAADEETAAEDAATTLSGRPLQYGKTNAHERLRAAQSARQMAVRARRAAVGGSVPADPPDTKLLAEVLDTVTDWTVSWWREPYEGWDGSLHRLECDARPHCYGCDPLNVTRAQVEAMRRNGVEVAELH